MNCEVAHERIVTAAYSELPDHEAHELERHLEDCPACQSEREQIIALQVLAGALPVLEPDANLVARARLRLEEALDVLPPRRWYERLAQRIGGGFATLQAAPIAAALVLVVGAGAGTFGGFQVAQRRAAAVPAAVAAAAPIADSANVQPAPENSEADFSNVANISSISRKPDSEMVDVAYSQVVPRKVTGSLDDPAIRQLLMLATSNQASARVRGDSVSLLASECKIGHSCQASGIRDALIVALRYDASPDVRQKALDGLQPYIEQDLRVRDAVLEALMNDTDPRIRSTSISLLAPVEADTSVRQVLNTVSTSDDNPHIRFVSRQILSQVPEIQ
jgi:anti-sigma factor RsiW